MTAGPIERALRFLKRTSVNCGAPAEGAGATEADNGGVVLAGDATGGNPAAGADAGGDSSWASETEMVTNKPKIEASRVLIRVKNKSWRLIGFRASASLVGLNRWQAERLPYNFRFLATRQIVVTL